MTKCLGIVKGPLLILLRRSPAQLFAFYIDEGSMCKHRTYGRPISKTLFKSLGVLKTRERTSWPWSNLLQLAFCYNGTFKQI